MPWFLFFKINFEFHHSCRLRFAALFVLFLGQQACAGSAAEDDASVCVCVLRASIRYVRMSAAIG